MEAIHPPRRLRARRIAGSLAVDLGYRALSRSARWLPPAAPRFHGLARDRDVAYASAHPSQRLDIYRPAGAEGPLPVIFYLHGGGFRALSKDTHWLMGLAYARQGYLVINVDYRLAPAFPFPAALADAAAALRWTVANAGRIGADLDHLFLAGESAGANLACALSVALCWERGERWARGLWALGLTPRGVLPYCGILQVTDAGRFTRRRSLHWFIDDRLREVEDIYLQGADGPEAALADPLLVLERAEPPSRPMPPFFVSVGTKDPLIDDSRRLEVALRALGVPCELHIHPGEMHAFHALVWRPEARRCWRHTFDFLQRNQGR